MAKPLGVTELKSALATDDLIRRDPFLVLRSLSILLNTPNGRDQGRDLLLRALEWQKSFGNLKQPLAALVRETGLFPYLDPNDLGFRDLLALECHRPFNMHGEFVFHHEQALVYHRLMSGDSVILSAPTSFGKSKVIDAVIASERFANIVVIVPTLALIDETRRRITAYAKSYKLVTHVSQPPAERNVFVMTAERAVGYERFPKIEFFVIDEFYKLGAVEEDADRTVALNKAFYRLARDKGQFYLLGPSVREIPQGFEEAYRCYFFPTQFSTVAVDTVKVPGKGKNLDRLAGVLATINEPTMIYCSIPSRANRIATMILENNLGEESPTMNDASRWIGRHYHPDWVFGRALREGVGIHHGRLPRSLAQFIVRSFNEGKLKYLVCTSTLIEGVNTKAKNVILWDSKVGPRPIDFFTFNNIKGRAGRMLQHFVGRVYLVDKLPDEELPFVDFPMFTQTSDTPESLLIHMERQDLSGPSKERLSKYTDEKVLPLELLRRNHGVEPADQVSLARAINANADVLWPLLSWRSFPTFDELKAVCDLIWTHFVKDSRSGCPAPRKMSQHV